MPTTRRQSARAKNGEPAEEHRKPAPARSRKASTKKSKKAEEAAVGEKREVENAEENGTKGDDKSGEKHPAKKAKVEDESEEKTESEAKAEPEAKDEAETKKDHPVQHTYQAGTIERGHIYFFYRPKVQLEEAESLDDVQRFYMVLVPRPPEFSSGSETAAKGSGDGDEDQEMNLISAGADAVPAAETTNEKQKRFRLIVLGKKSLPDPDQGRGRGSVFWGAITTVGEDLIKLQDGLGPKEYETKTRGHRTQGPARLAARGAYALVNKEARIPSQRETHLGYHLSHPDPEHVGEVQAELGIHEASSFVIQVKNPLAPPTGPQRVGLPKERRADYSEAILREVFGKGGERGREEFGLRFASVEQPELLDYEGAELLFIAARSGDAGLEQSLGEGRGEALHEVEEKDSKIDIENVLKELAIDAKKIPSDPLEGKWV
ncbi:hypothetical protein CERSUDRAFT_126728 [Gelatoporia subvermispora B]|uniref:Uncharacterized protein n=1 Tax=Ceriporiopsis subvermispora (strain B) TaxID=914234 RepID=M2R175_CERS8|nr:hypothetical protein CERSUDRAFT_126728 [Gelatoporia subvermispora B]